MAFPSGSRGKLSQTPPFPNNTLGWEDALVGWLPVAVWNTLQWYTVLSELCVLWVELFSDVHKPPKGLDGVTMSHLFSVTPIRSLLPQARAGWRSLVGLSVVSPGNGCNTCLFFYCSGCTWMGVSWVTDGGQRTSLCSQFPPPPSHRFES